MSDVSCLRVVVVTVTHLPEDARIRYRQIPALLSRGHEVTYVAPFVAYGVTPPPEVRPIDVPRSRGLRRVRAVLAAARVLHRLAAERGVDVVLAHDPELVPALLWLKVCHRRLAVVWDVHEDVPSQVDQVPEIPRVVRRPLAWAIHAVERVAEARLHLLLAEHGYAERFARAHQVVPNSTWVPPTRPLAPIEDRLVYVGALTWPRGAAEMVAVARLLPDVTVELIGTARPDVEEMLASAPANVVVRGFLPNAPALDRTHGALAGLVLLRPHTNYLNSQFTKVLEYMAHGVPTITTANPAARDLVQAAGSGLVVPHGSVDEVATAVAAAVRRLQGQAGLREQMAAAGYQRARRDHDWTSDGQRFAEQLESWAAADANSGGRRASTTSPR